MFVSPAYAQATGAAPGSTDLLMSLVPFILIFVIMWFLIIRPQRQRMKAHEEMVKNIRRGDVVVTAGGLIGKIAKVTSDTEVEIELNDTHKVKLIRTAISEVRSKGEPVKE
jgi:preprotein translocase subunit YajC